jgi:hypothetical protein
MARHPSTPKSENQRRIEVALLVLATCCTAPALAAKPDAALCKESRTATLEIPAAELLPRIVHHEISLKMLDETAAAMESNERAPERYLTPQAEAAIWNAFENSDNIVFERHNSLAAISAVMTPIADNDSTTEDTEKKPTQEKPDMNARFPGVSDEELVRYKKQMFRRDI